MREVTDRAQYEGALWLSETGGRGTFDRTLPQLPAIWSQLP